MCEVRCSLMVRGPIHYFKSGYGAKFKIYCWHGIFTGIFSDEEILTVRGGRIPREEFITSISGVARSTEL